MAKKRSGSTAGQPAPTLDICEMPIAEIDRAEYNPRKALTPDDKEWQDIERSLRRFGQVEPLVWNARTKRLVGGHQRLSVLKAMGRETVPVAVVDLPEAEEKALNVALNRVTGRWDQALLGTLLEDLDAELRDATGLLDSEIDKALAALLDEPDTSEPARTEAPPRCQHGDLWRVGPHRVICGDCTNPDAMARLMDGGKANLVHTDPPYGVSYTNDAGETVANDSLTGHELQAFLRDAFVRTSAVTTPDAAWYIWHASSTSEAFRRAMEAAGLVERQTLIWAKTTPALGHADYQWAHEPCFYATMQGAQRTWNGARDQATVWRMAAAAAAGERPIALGKGVLLETPDGRIMVTPPPKNSKTARRISLQPGQSASITHAPAERSTVWEVGKDHMPDHPTQKPVELPMRAIRNSSHAGDTVLDPFGGSGSTAVAAARLGRIARTCELEPKHCDTILARLEAETGEGAEKL